MRQALVARSQQRPWKRVPPAWQPARLLQHRELLRPVLRRGHLGGVGARAAPVQNLVHVREGVVAEDVPSASVHQDADLAVLPLVVLDQVGAEAVIEVEGWALRAIQVQPVHRPDVPESVCNADTAQSA